MAQGGMSDVIHTSVEMAEQAELDCRRGLATTRKGKPQSVETTPLPKSVARKLEDKSPAQWAYERVILYIKNFEEQLDTEHEVAMGFTGGDAGILRIEGIGWFAPDILTFYGEDDEGSRTQLIQHVSQLNVMLRALPKAPEEETARRIGFRLAEGLEPPAEATPAPQADKPKRKPGRAPKGPGKKGS
jgi:hypothetical protein